MKKTGYFRHIVLMLCVWFAPVPSLQAQEDLTGRIDCHDPSTLITDGSTYFFFSTGSGVPYRYSTDLRNWSDGGKIFAGSPPAWVIAAVPGYDPGNWAWAPDVAYFNGKYHVYYSVSSWGTITSVVGLVTSPSLTSPSWTDQGKVVQSDTTYANGADTTSYNCIDPSILVDTNGTVWMTFGSYSSGILITEIDPATGLRMNTNSLAATQVANNAPGASRGWGSSIEGAFTYQHGGYYYLFVNYGGCCSGVDSTYNIRVGRSTSVTGPYYDKDGVDMRDAGGTMLLESSGRFVGPGHAGILNDGGTEWFSYHYYTWDGYWSQLGLLKLTWDEDDWPVLPHDWSAFYPFNKDAREHSDWFDGSLQSGATVVSDAALGKALELDGSGYVELHDGVANCSSVATWVKWNGTNDWERIFDFGDGTGKYMFLTPRAYLGGMRFAIRNGGSEQPVDAPFVLPTNTWCHVAVTLDGKEGILYFNGDPVATNTITIRPWEILARANYIGKSQWPDPGFEGRIASFRVFAHALSPDEVKEIAYAHPALAHRYSFVSDAGDSVGMAHGTLKGSATISGEALSLPGGPAGPSGSYAQLPGGLITGSGAVSIEFWADIGANGYWTRVFDFGNISGGNGYSFLFLTPQWAPGTYRMDMNGNALDVTGNLNNTSAHVVCIVDPSANYTAMYVNGVLVKQQTASTSALSTIGKQWSFLGRSLFSADPYLDADIEEFRIYDGRLTPDEIADNYAAGPDVMYAAIGLSMTNVVDGLRLEWPTYPLFALDSTTELGTNSMWQTLSRPIPANGYFRSVLPVYDPGAPSNAFFRLSR